MSLEREREILVVSSKKVFYRKLEKNIELKISFLQ